MSEKGNKAHATTTLPCPKYSLLKLAETAHTAGKFPVRFQVLQRGWRRVLCVELKTSSHTPTQKHTSMVPVCINKAVKEKPLCLPALTECPRQVPQSYQQNWNATFLPKLPQMNKHSCVNRSSTRNSSNFIKMVWPVVGSCCSTSPPASDKLTEYTYNKPAQKMWTKKCPTLTQTCTTPLSPETRFTNAPAHEVLVTFAIPGTTCILSFDA